MARSSSDAPLATPPEPEPSWWAPLVAEDDTAPVEAEISAEAPEPTVD